MFKFKVWLCFHIQPILLFASKLFTHFPLGIGHPFSVMNNKLRVALANPILDYIAKESGLTHEFGEHDSHFEPTMIGNKVWMFWYSGYETAPPLIKKCIDRVRSIEGIDFIFIDKDNLQQYFGDYDKVMPIFYAGRISVTHLSDLLRLYLLKEYGGFWLDATIFVIDRNFFNKRANQVFWTLKYAESEFFNKGKFSTFLVTSGKGEVVMKLAYRMLFEYLNRFETFFDYFLLDFTIYFLYRTFPSCTNDIDAVSTCTEITDLWALVSIRMCKDEGIFNDVMKSNVVQKVTYKANKTVRPLEIVDSAYNRLLKYED